jgi:hypothetical protein
VGVSTDAIIESGRLRPGFLISSALVAITSKPMKVTYTVAAVEATAPQPLGLNGRKVPQSMLKTPKARKTRMNPISRITIRFWRDPASLTPR